jgi:hypothetical protein
VAAEAADRSSWRSSRYGRKGAEIWFEIPRYGMPTGKGYREDYDLDPGLGFGFGIMFGFTENLAFEGMMLQTNHLASADERDWDIDIIHIGLRRTFFENNLLQPFVAAGWAKLALELDSSIEQGGDFHRLTGYGGYASIGVDYIPSASWSFFFRTDYTMGGFSHRTIGTEEDKFKEPLKANNLAVSFGVAYRIPTW